MRDLVKSSKFDHWNDAPQVNIFRQSSDLFISTCGTLNRVWCVPSLARFLVGTALTEQFLGDADMHCGIHSAHSLSTKNMRI